MTQSGPQFKRWTHTVPGALPPRPSPYTDPLTKGLRVLVRQNKRGITRSYLFRFAWQGTDATCTIGDVEQISLSDARLVAQKWAGFVKDGIDPRRARENQPAPLAPPAASAAVSSPDAKHTWEYLRALYFDTFVKIRRPKSWEQLDKLFIKDIDPQWRGRDARSITRDEVNQLLDGVVARGAPAVANDLAPALANCFKLGIVRNVLSISPVVLMSAQPGGRERPRRRVWDESEIDGYFANPQACTRTLRMMHILNTFLLTGARRSDLACARWEHVNVLKREWYIPATKIDERPMVVPLTNEALLEFEALQRLAQGSPWVLPAQTDSTQHLVPKQLTRAMARLQQRFAKVGIKHSTLHDSRRVVRSTLARLKVTREIAERVINHEKEQLEGTYNLYEYLDEKRDALEKLAAYYVSHGYRHTPDTHIPKTHWYRERTRRLTRARQLARAA